MPYQIFLFLGLVVGVVMVIHANYHFEKFGRLMVAGTGFIVASLAGLAGDSPWVLIPGVSVGILLVVTSFYGHFKFERHTNPTS